MGVDTITQDKKVRARYPDTKQPAKYDLLDVVLAVVNRDEAKQ